MGDTGKKIQKIALIGVVVVLFVIVAFVAYRIFWEFNNKAVEIAIDTEASKYQDKATASMIIRAGVKHILGSAELTKQVKDYARAKGLPKETVLVQSAVLQAQAVQYL